jgi:hypothetical protein
MKKVFAILPLVALMTACQSMKPQAESTPAAAVVASKEPVLPTEQYDNRVAREQNRRDAQVEKSIAQAPDWMSKLPTSDNAVYANGSAVSSDMSMADYKAKLFAFGKICMAAGGQVDQQSKVYMMDNESGGSEMSDTAIRSICKTVDITGVETVNVKTIAEGTRFRSYVLVSLPTGDANRLQVRKDNVAARKVGERRANEAFNELDANSKKPAE